MPPSDAETRATKAGKWLFAALVPASGLALGSVPPSVLVVMSILAAVACVLLWLDRDVPISRASRWVILAVALLVVATALQCLPLPAGLARALTPTNAEIWDRALVALHEPGPLTHPLSVAPGASRLELLRGLFYASAFLGALRITSLEHGERFLTRLVVASAVAMAVSALAHAALGAERVFGIYRPRELHAYAPNRFAPLLNTNHLAAYLNVGTCVALGALLSRRSIPRALSGSAVLILVGMSMWQGSRGAAGSLVFGLLLLFALQLYAKRRIESGRAGTAVLVACALAALFLVVVTYSEASSHFLQTDTQKGDVARRSLGLVWSSPWFGFGRGSFETVFSAVRRGAEFATWTNPEDIVIQWLVEWGLPVTVLGFGLLGWAFRPQLVLRAVRPAVGAWVAIVTTVMHDLVDFHLEVPGIVVLVAVCAALVVSGRPTSRDPSRTTPAASARFVSFATAVATLVVVAWAWSDIGHSLAETRRQLGAEALDRSLPPEQFKVDVRSAMLRFPAEPFIPLMGAVRAQTDGESVIPWIARALERSPRFGRAHLVLARSLAASHPAQARLEYRLAYENDVSLRDPIAKESVRTIEDAPSALELVPDGPDGVPLLDALASAIAPRLPSASVMLDEELERRAPTSLAPVRRRVEAQVLDATSDASWCTVRRTCLEGALAAADELTRREPDRCEPYVLVARVRVKLGDTDAALDALAKDQQKVVDHAHCLQELVMLANEVGQTRRADAAMEQLVRGGCGGTQDCLDLYAWAGGMEESRGHYVRASRLYRRILDIAPDREDLLERIGGLGDKDGMLSDALEAYRTLGLRHPDDPKYPARTAELRARYVQHPLVVPTVPTPADSAEP